MSEIKIPSINVSKLDLSNKNLKAIPPEIFELKNLKSLNLRNNKISNIPPEITRLKRLEKLDISNNNISNFYANICRLKKLQVLNFNNNKIKTIPIQINLLSELRKLSLSGNYINSLPKQMAGLKKLRSINISKNPINNFPQVLLELKELKTIWINNLNLKTFPVKSVLESLKNLKAIYCYGEKIDNESIDVNYLYLSKIKGNSYPDLIRLKSNLDRSEKIHLKKTSPMKEIKNSYEKKKIFISYSHQDSNWLEEVKKNLKVLEFSEIDFEVWDDTKIHSGAKWKEEIEKALKECKIAILLVSTDFLASDFIQNNELPPLLKKAEEDGTTILPLIVGHCRFAKDKNLKEFQAVNNPSKPLISCSKADIQKILVKLTDDVERIILT